MEYMKSQTNLFTVQNATEEIWSCVRLYLDRWSTTKVDVVTTYMYFLNKRLDKMRSQDSQIIGMLINGLIAVGEFKTTKAGIDPVPLFSALIEKVPGERNRLPTVTEVESRNIMQWANRNKSDWSANYQNSRVSMGIVDKIIETFPHLDTPQKALTQIEPLLTFSNSLSPTYIFVEIIFSRYGFMLSKKIINLDDQAGFYELPPPFKIAPSDFSITSLIRIGVQVTSHTRSRAEETAYIESLKPQLVYSDRVGAYVTDTLSFFAKTVLQVIAALPNTDALKTALDQPAININARKSFQGKMIDQDGLAMLREGNNLHTNLNYAYSQWHVASKQYLLGNPDYDSSQDVTINNIVTKIPFIKFPPGDEPVLESTRDGQNVLLAWLLSPLLVDANNEILGPQTRDCKIVDIQPAVFVSLKKVNAITKAETTVLTQRPIAFLKQLIDGYNIDGKFYDVKSRAKLPSEGYKAFSVAIKK